LHKSVDVFIGERGRPVVTWRGSVFDSGRHTLRQEVKQNSALARGSPGFPTIFPTHRVPVRGNNRCRGLLDCVRPSFSVKIGALGDWVVNRPGATKFTGQLSKPPPADPHPRGTPLNL